MSDTLATRLLASLAFVTLLALLGALFGPSALDVPDEREGGL